MKTNEDNILTARIDKIRTLSRDDQGSEEVFEAAMLAQAVLHDTLGGGHPLMTTLSDALHNNNWTKSVAASRALITLFDEGKLASPRLIIAHEIEGNLLDVAQAQTQLAEADQENFQKQLHLAIASFLAGAMLEDILRRLCDARSIAYDTQHTSISKLQSVLYQPTKQIEVISQSENKQITTWGDTRNKADHGKFSEITYAEVISMVIGVRAFVDKHLP